MRISKLSAVIQMGLWAAASASTAFGQSTLPAEKLDSPRPGERAFHAALAEAHKGIILTYRQAYRSNHRRVSVDGTLYVVLERFDAADCQIHVQASATDIYSGSIGRKLIPGTQIVHRTSAEFRLSPAIADSSRVVEKRPAQLHGDTHPACEERADCTIPWLEIQTGRPVIKIENSTDDIEGYDGFVKNGEGYTSRFDIPLNSLETGKALAGELREMALRCGD